MAYEMCFSNISRDVIAHEYVCLWYFHWRKFFAMKRGCWHFLTIYLRKQSVTSAGTFNDFGLAFKVFRWKFPSIDFQSKNISIIHIVTNNVDLEYKYQLIIQSNLCKQDFIKFALLGIPSNSISSAKNFYKCQFTLRFNWDKWRKALE